MPQDQVLSPKLEGGERLVLLRLHPTAERVTVEMPRLRLAAAFRTDEGSEEVPMVADTLLVEPDEGRFSITFRAGKAFEDPREVRTVVYRQTAASSASSGRSHRV